MTNLKTLREFSALITGDHEIPYADPEWLNTGEVRWNDIRHSDYVFDERTFLDRALARPIRYIKHNHIERVLEQKWLLLHKGEIIDTEWRKVPEPYKGLSYE